jgi:hypothetical protein
MTSVSTLSITLLEAPVKVSEFKLGMRVRRRSGESSFVRDRLGKSRRVGIVVGLPESVSDKHKAAAVQYEGTLRLENVLIHRLEALPLKQQPVALGGQWVADETTFLNGAKSRALQGGEDAGFVR